MHNIVLLTLTLENTFNPFRKSCETNLSNLLKDFISLDSILVIKLYTYYIALASIRARGSIATLLDFKSPAISYFLK